MNIFKMLTILKDNNIAVRPFNNYDAATVVERTTDGLHFKTDAEEWPIHAVEYSGAGNLNLKFVIDGSVEFAGKRIPCKEIRNVTIVKNGELKQQFLQLTKDKSQQEPVAGFIKNNILNLAMFDLTDETEVDANKLFVAAVNNFISKLNTAPRQKFVPQTAEESVLADLGLKNGIFTKPVLNQTTVEANDKIEIKLDGLSSKTTKLAKKLKELNLTVDNDFNKLLYIVKCKHINVNGNFQHVINDEITVTGKIV